MFFLKELKKPVITPVVTIVVSIDPLRDLRGIYGLVVKRIISTGNTCPQACFTYRSYAPILNEFCKKLPSSKKNKSARDNDDDNPHQHQIKPLSVNKYMLALR